MKKWELVAVSGILELALGVTVVLWGFQAMEPIHIEHAATHIAASLDTTFILLLIAGFSLCGMAIADLAIAPIIYNLEKQLLPLSK